MVISLSSLKVIGRGFTWPLTLRLLFMTHFQFHIAKLRLGKYYLSDCNSGIIAIHSLGGTVGYVSNNLDHHGRTQSII